MSNYSRAQNWGLKDSATSGSPNKLLIGEQFNTEFDRISDAILSKANLGSPVLTGIPKADTASVGTNTTQLATTAFVKTEISTEIAVKAPIANPTFTGIPAADTAAVGTTTTQLATTAFVMASATAAIVNNLVYPIGSVYTGILATNPSDAALLGMGTWVAFGTGTSLVGFDAGDTDFDLAGETGGSKTHQLLIAEMPNHAHTVIEGAVGAPQGGTLTSGDDMTHLTGATQTSSYVGGGLAFPTQSPYTVVYFWKRTA